MVTVCVARLVLVVLFDARDGVQPTPPLSSLLPRPALAPQHAVLALPADDRVKRASLDRPSTTDTSRKSRTFAARSRVPAELRLLGLREHVEPPSHVVAVHERAQPDRVAVDRELEGGLDLGVRIPARRGLEVHDSDEANPALQVARKKRRAGTVTASERKRSKNLVSREGHADAVALVTECSVPVT